jgi:hypothetical protein
MNYEPRWLVDDEQGRIPEPDIQVHLLRTTGHLIIQTGMDLDEIPRTYPVPGPAGTAGQANQVLLDPLLETASGVIGKQSGKRLIQAQSRLFRRHPGGQQSGLLLGIGHQEVILRFPAKKRSLR